MTVMEELPTRRSMRGGRRSAEPQAQPDAALAGADEPAAESRARGVWRSIVLGLSTGFLLLMALLATLVIILPFAVGGSPLTVLTSSMEPNLPPGTLVIVKPTPASEIGVGQVMTYQLESGRPELVTHRVIERTVAEDGTVTFITQGDNNSLPDANPVQEVQIRGTVWYAIPYLGWVNQWLTGDTRAWLVPVLAGGLFAYAAWMLYSGIRDRRRARARE